MQCSERTHSQSSSEELDSSPEPSSSSSSKASWRVTASPPRAHIVSKKVPSSPRDMNMSVCCVDRSSMFYALLQLYR